jgi:hypothetical protein
MEMLFAYLRSWEITALKNHGTGVPCVSGGRFGVKENGGAAEMLWAPDETMCGRECAAVLGRALAGA